MIKTQTYLAISESIRKQSAQKARADLRTQLAGPLSTEQRAELVAKLQRIDLWEAGLLPVDGKVMEPKQVAGLAALKSFSEKS